jgi:hydroxymethylglutaryl-CoA synthase
MSTKNEVGIISYGAYLPQLSIKTETIALANNSTNLGICLGVDSKTVPDADEDTATFSVQAAFQAISRTKDSVKKNIQALFVGSESHPYLVKPTGTIVSAALGLGQRLAMADLQFACKAGTQALQICLAYVKSGLAEYALAIGADTAQSCPGDALEYTAGAGGAAFIVGTKNPLVTLLATTSVATDTPDFWRRPQQNYPQHAGRFSGNPAYFYHTSLATRRLLDQTGLSPGDFNYCLFHTPNFKFPASFAKEMGFTKKQMKYSLLVKKIGNLYAGSTLVGLVNILDHAKNGDKILMVSYGSGSGSDAFVWQCSSDFAQKKKLYQNLLSQQINKNLISYSQYQHLVKI